MCIFWGILCAARRTIDLIVAANENSTSADRLIANYCIEIGRLTIAKNSRAGSRQSRLPAREFFETVRKRLRPTEFRFFGTVRKRRRPAKRLITDRGRLPLGVVLLAKRNNMAGWLAAPAGMDAPRLPSVGMTWAGGGWNDMGCRGLDGHG